MAPDPPDRATAADQWGTGSAYEPYVGRWSRLVARNFIQWLDPPSGGRWCDVGCGTGALTEAILEAAQPTSVVGVDPSEDYAGFARTRVADPRARFEVGDALHLSARGVFDYVVSGLVLNFVSEPSLAVAEMKRHTRPEGCVAAYVWDYAEGMEMVRHYWDAAAEVDPRATALDEGVLFPICEPGALQSLWEQAALREVTVVGIDIDTVFRNFDDYWSPFLGGQGPAPRHAMSLEDSVRMELKDTLRRRLPVQEDGSIQLRARSWAVRGRK